MSHMWVRAAAIISIAAITAPAGAQEIAAGGDPASIPIQLLDRQAKLSVDGVPLQAALDELTLRSAAPIAYSPSQLPDRTVTCDCASVTVADALDQILDGTAATYREMHGQIVISRTPPPALPDPRDGLASPVTLVMANAISRTPLSLREGYRFFPLVGTVTGLVRETTTREAIRGAQITVADSPLQAITDDRGAYSLSNVPAGSAILRVNAIGFAPMEMSISVRDGESVKQDFDLARRAFELDAIVVTGTAGGTLTRAIGNVVSTVDAAQILAATPAPNVEQLLAARTPGVAVLPATGQVGTGAPIRIRGTNSMALVNEPIVFIDGVRIDSDPRQGPNQLTTSRVSRLSDLNPDDIQSIEIIKGPSAATLYGTEASNGVVQIITKRGAAGRPQIDFTIRRGSNWLENPEERAGLRWWRDAAGQLQSINLYQQERLHGTGPIFHNGALQSYSANLSGGNPNMRYFASTSYDHDVGVVSWNWDKRISTRLNLDMTVSDKISARMNTMYVDRKISLAQTNYNTDPFSNLVWGNPRTLNTPVRGFFRTPPEEWGEVESRADNSRITLGLELKHTPFRWFTHRLSTGLDRNDGDNVVLHPRQPEGASHFWGQQGLGQKVVDHAARRMMTLDYSSSATFRPFTDMEFTTSGGFQYYQRQTSTITANGREFPAIPLTTVSAGGIKTSAETFEENATVGVYVQQQLAWRNRVFLTGAVRGDDNSAFGAQYDAAIYPKLSGTWVMNEESFWPLPWVSQFKLRAAWGAAGQQPGTFDASQLYDPEVSGNDQAVLVPGSYGNPALSPERSDELEYGFDATLLDGRIELNVTRYRRRITDAIVNRPVPPSTGFPGNQIVNLGKVTGSGNELGINARVLEGQKFGVDVGFQVSTNQNRIEDLGGLDVIGVNPNARQEHRPGFPVGGIFIKHIISAEVNAAGVLGRSFCDGGTGPTGLERGGPVVDCAVAPRVYWSPSMPTWQFGFNTTFTVLRNLRLYARIEGNGGHHTINTELRASHNLGITEAVLRGDDPLMLATRRDENDVMGLYDGSFARLREVALTYTLSPSWLSIVRASRGSITVSARNLMMLWTGAHGFGTPRDGRVRQVRGLGGEWTWDPEIRNPSQIQSDYTVYMPPTTSATVTVRLGF